MAQKNGGLATNMTKRECPSKQSDGLSGGQLLWWHHVAVPGASAWWHRTLCKVWARGCERAARDPGQRFVVEPGWCSRRCSQMATVAAAVREACIRLAHEPEAVRSQDSCTHTHCTLAAQCKRQAGLTFTGRRRASCRSGSPAGSDRERERAEIRDARRETRDSRAGDAKHGRGLGARQGFVASDRIAASC
jgi:hypothetical protein